MRAPTGGIRSQIPSSGESSIRPAETSSAVSTPARSVRCPQPQLPIAMPPAIEAWKAASERPATQRGAESCTPMLNRATASIHTAPAITRATAVRTAFVLSATAAIAPAIDIAQARTAASPLMRLRTSPMFSAPITAPMPNAPSMMP